jgi:hypothetical protein
LRGAHTACAPVPVSLTLKPGAIGLLTDYYPELDQLPPHLREDGQTVYYLNPAERAAESGRSCPVRWIDHLPALRARRGHRAASGEQAGGTTASPPRVPRLARTDGSRRCGEPRALDLKRGMLRASDELADGRGRLGQAAVERLEN